MVREKGYIRHLNMGKGYGFIAKEMEDPAAIFFHANALMEAEFKDLREGQTVTFVKVPAPKGTKAIAVRIENNEENENE